MLGRADDLSGVGLFGGFGPLGIRERAAYVGGILKVKSIRRAGTTIEIRIPLPPSATAAKSGARKVLLKG